MIYFIQPVDGGRIKIGTTIRVADRLIQLCKESGQTLRVLAVLEGSFDEEADLHRRFAHLRAVNEWFEPGDDLLGFIVEAGQEWDASEAISASIRLPGELARDARTVANREGKTLPQWVIAVLTPIVAREYDRYIAAEASRRAKKEGK